MLNYFRLFFHVLWQKTPKGSDKSKTRGLYVINPTWLWLHFYLLQYFATFLVNGTPLDRTKLAALLPGRKRTICSTIRIKTWNRQQINISRHFGTSSRDYCVPWHQSWKFTDLPSLKWTRFKPRTSKRELPAMQTTAFAYERKQLL